MKENLLLVTMSPKDRRNHFFSMLFTCGFTSPLLLYFVLSGNNDSLIPYFLLILVPISFFYFSELIPSIFNSVELSDDTLILNGVDEGRVKLPKKSIFKVEQKHDWVSRLGFNSEGNVFVIHAKFDDEQVKEYSIRLFKEMNNRNAFIEFIGSQ